MTQEKLTQEEIDDLILVLEMHVDGGEDALAEDFNLVGEQNEDMMQNLQSALAKLRTDKS